MANMKKGNQLNFNNHKINPISMTENNPKIRENQIKLGQ